MQQLQLDDGQKREDGLKSPEFLNFQTKSDPRCKNSCSKTM